MAKNGQSKTAICDLARYTSAMKRFFSKSLYALALVSLLGCTMELNQPGTANPPSGVGSLSPTSVAPDASGAAPSSTIHVTWADLNLSGRLVYSTVSNASGVYTSRIQMLDLVTGGINTVFTVTGNAWIYYLTVSPDSKQLIMSYAPPSEPGSISSTSLYVLPLEGADSPQLLFTPPSPVDRFIQVEWSPDGKYVYFVHYNPEGQSSDQATPAYQISRMAFPGGQPEKIFDHAFWARVSPDSSKLVYVSAEPGSVTNKLFVANADGTDPREVVFSAPPQIIDAPLFSPDGRSILYSAPSPAQSYQPNLLDRLMGIQVVKAHNIPSDWWSVPVTGGAPTRLTQIQTIKLFASISPDQTRIASVSGEGIFVMDLDGANLRQLLFDPGVSSTVSWTK